MESTYLCAACQKSLPPVAFSKSQINKLQHKKIDSVRCTECTATAVVLVDGPSKPKGDKSGKGDKPTEEKKSEVKQYDPSAQYTRNPRDTPIVKDAVAYATSKGLEYKVKLGPREGWRTVVKMAVRGVIKKNKKGKEHVVTTIGLFKPGSHNVVACTDSKAHHPSINAALRAVEEARASVDLQGYIEGSGYDGEDSDTANHPNCYLKYVILVLARNTSKVQLSVVWNTEPKIHSAGERMLTQFITALLGNAQDASSEHALFHSVWVNYNPSSRYNNAITGRGEDAWTLLFGDRYIHEVVRTDMVEPPTLLFPPFVFRQANICAFTNIIVNVRHWIKDMIKQRGSSCDPSNNSASEAGKLNKRKVAEMESSTAVVPDINCVELYAGVGTIGLNCLDLFTELNCSDENPHNLACFEAARLQMQPKRIRQRASYRSEGATAVAQSGGLRGFDLVIVDPPRKGLDDEVVQALLEYDHRGASHSTGQAGQASRKIAKYGTDGEVLPVSVTNAPEPVRNNMRLIYVSCGFPAFKRDAARLVGSSTAVGAEAGSEGLRHWKLVHLEGHILFPGSDHIETLAIFDRVV